MIQLCERNPKIKRILKGKHRQNDQGQNNYRAQPQARTAQRTVPRENFLHLCSIFFAIYSMHPDDDVLTDAPSSYISSFSMYFVWRSLCDR